MSVTAKIEGNKIIITADLDGKERSASGKSIVKATTSGFIGVDGNSNIKYSLNVITK
jgi:hypothetical protein